MINCITLVYLFTIKVTITANEEAHKILQSYIAEFY